MMMADRFESNYGTGELNDEDTPTYKRFSGSED